ncbi:MAG: hypothetical protein ACK55Z_17850, partial [bacterium]
MKRGEIIGFAHQSGGNRQRPTAPRAHRVARLAGPAAMFGSPIALLSGPTYAVTTGPPRSAAAGSGSGSSFSPATSDT